MAVAETAGNDLAVADFIAPSLVQYLGVCSLHSFAATCKFLRAVVSREIERRKTCIVEIEAEVKRLLAPHQKQSTDLSGYIKKEERYERHSLSFRRRYKNKYGVMTS